MRPVRQASATLSKKHLAQSFEHELHRKTCQKDARHSTDDPKLVAQVVKEIASAVEQVAA